jgi:hypothetical protein
MGMSGHGVTQLWIKCLEQIIPENRSNFHQKKTFCQWVLLQAIFRGCLNKLMLPFAFEMSFKESIKICSDKNIKCKTNILNNN